MKFIITVVLLTLISACNFKEGLKGAGDTIQGGAQNAAEDSKDVPGDVSEASNKAESDIKE